MERHGRNDADCRGLVGAERFKRLPEGRRYVLTTPERGLEPVAQGGVRAALRLFPPRLATKFC
jgi:hypothetical protein